MVKRQIFISVLFLNHRFKLGYRYGQIVDKKFNVIVAFVFVYLNIMYKKPKWYVKWWVKEYMVDIIFCLKTMEQVPMLLWRCRHHDISWSTDVVYDVTIKGHCDLLPPSCFGGHRHFRYPFSFGCHITLEIEIVNNLRIYLRPRTAVHLCCNMQRIIMVFLQSGLVARYSVNNG